MISQAVLNNILSNERNRLAGRNFLEKSIRQNYEIFKLQFAKRMRERSARRLISIGAAVTMGFFIPHHAALILNPIVSKIVNKKTTGEILNDALTFYNIADIYAKKIQGKIDKNTVQIYVKAGLYLDLANALMSIVEKEKQSFIDAVNQQFQAKNVALQAKLPSLLSKGDFLLDDSISFTESVAATDSQLEHLKSLALSNEALF